MEHKCEVLRLGVIPYEQAWRLQDELAAEIQAGKRPATLLLLEHPHTYTFGRSGHSENLLWDEAELKRRGITLYWVDRGGDVTYHGPGQLVGYPLLPLAQGGLRVEPGSGKPRLPQADYVGYVRKLEQTLIGALARLGVAGRSIKGMTGVWVQPDSQRPPAKIAAIGVKVDARGVSRHGFALNINPDMSYWEGIIGCGLKDFPVTCLAELLQPVPSIEQVMDEVVTAFASVFGYEMVPVVDGKQKSQ
ncbi:MAG: lipoyl(octanoyl) transferase LipB [Omnitrophica WOR_2 bacterium]